MILAALLLIAAAQPRTFAEERALLDRRLEALRRLLPDGPTAEGDVAVLREVAQGVRLLPFEASPRPPVESGNVGFVIVDIAGNGRFVDVEKFFRQIALLARPVDVEALTLKATPDDVVRLTAVVRFPFRSRKAPLPPPPTGARAPSGAARPQADALLRDHALALAKSDSLASLRRSRRNPRLFLSELAAVARERPVVFTEAQLGEEFHVRGLTVGEHPSRELMARFERGFFRISEFLMARQGACRRFEAKGKSPVAGPEAELPLPMEDPFRQDDGSCRVDRDGPRAAAIQEPASRARPYAPNADDLQALAGRYESDELRAVFQMTPGKEALMIRHNDAHGEGLEFRLVERDIFQRGMMTMRFGRDQAGEIVGFDFSNPALRNIQFTRLSDG